MTPLVWYTASQMTPTARPKAPPAADPSSTATVTAATGSSMGDTPKNLSRLRT